MKVLVTLKDIETRKRHGGIGHYYKSVRPHFDSGVTYFTIGKRPDRRGYLDDVGRLVKDYVRFWRLLGTDVDLVNVNPSLGAAGLLRDGVLLLMARVRRKKTVVFFRGWSDKAADGIDRRWKAPFMFAFGRAAGMIVLSGAFKRKLREWGYRGPIWVETTTVDERILRSVSVRPETKGECNLLFLARIERDKGIYAALEAHELLRRRNVKTRLTVAGDGSELEAVRRFVHERQIPDIDFAGYLENDEKRKAFENADVYLFPSAHGEGMPNSVLEAMAFGLPVVTTQVGGLVEFFKDGKMGYWLKQTDADYFSRVIEKLVNNRELCLEMGRNNQEYARQHFVASKVAHRLRSIWEEVNSADADAGAGQKGRAWSPEIGSLEENLAGQEGRL